ncbi:NAD(P)/FAD-dependent oxidoreductase [Pararoseomonas indoligenes]|uniref:FAD-binding oxidoreductase n=1 Tax=Roseomonas indoligenes TaxID=2820811 RepID=A0A940N352_9PROT|nr:FAD-binding oxidoreductase [Pararoseomonas indoligenes]
MSAGASGVLVVGAGVAGLSAALHLLRAGQAVTVLDPGPAGTGASFGNAGMISAAVVAPASVPGIVRQLPHWLLDPSGPVAIRPSRLPGALPWLLRWLAAGRLGRVRAISAALHALHRHSFAEWRNLLGAATADALLRPSGQVLGLEAPARPETAALDRALREGAGIPSEMLDRPALEALFPGLAPSVGRGLLLPGNGYCVNPGRLIGLLGEAVRRAGGAILAERVRALRPEGDGWLATTEAGDHRAARAVVAAGAWSPPLLRPLGLRLPMEAERGYHAMLPDPSVELPMPISVRTRGLGLAPMEHGLRAAGLVEIAGLDAPADERRAQRLAAGARALFPGLRHGPPTLWMGPRPGLPDSLPAIGPVPGRPGLFLCTGHGHFGLTSGPVSGRLLAALLTGRAAPINPQPYDPSRFGGLRR